MVCKHFLFKLVAVQWPRFAAFLGLDERRADRFEIGLAGLVAAYQIADIFAIVGEFPSGNPRLVQLSCWSVTLIVLRVVPIK